MMMASTKTGPVAAGGSLPDQQQQPSRQQQEARQVDDIGRRWERGLGEEHPLVAVVDSVAGGEHEQPGCQKEPGQRLTRPVSPDPYDQSGDRREAERRIRSRLEPRRGQQEVSQGEQRLGAEEHPEDSTSHACIIGGFAGNLCIDLFELVKSSTLGST